MVTAREPGCFDLESMEGTERRNGDVERGGSENGKESIRISDMTA